LPAKTPSPSLNRRCSALRNLALVAVIAVTTGSASSTVSVFALLAGRATLITQVLDEEQFALRN
jgi:hypothetical protein